MEIRVSEDYEGRGIPMLLRENRLKRVADTAHHKKEIKVRLLVFYLKYNSEILKIFHYYIQMIPKKMRISLKNKKPNKKSNKKVTNTKRKITYVNIDIVGSCEISSIRQKNLSPPGTNGCCCPCGNVGLPVIRDDRDLVAQYFKGAGLWVSPQHGVEFQDIIEREAQQFIQQGHQRFFKIRNYINGYVLIGGDENGNPDWDTIKVFINK